MFLISGAALAAEWNTLGDTWKQPLLAIERREEGKRVNYPRLTLAGHTAWVSAFTGGSSTIVKIVDLDSTPRVRGRIDTTPWVAHAFPRGDELLIVGRAGASGHKLESAPRRCAGERHLCCVGRQRAGVRPRSGCGRGSLIHHGTTNLWAT